LPSYTEALDSRSIQTSGRKATATRKFYATEVTDPGFIVLAISAGTSLPKLGSTFPTLGALFCMDYAITPISGSGDSYEVVFQYEQSGGITTLLAGDDPGDENKKLSGELGFVEQTADIRSEFAPAFRLGVSYPILGLVTGDIEVRGYSVDAAGSPISIQRNITELTVSEIHNRSSLEIKQDSMRAMRFRRNNGVFLKRYPVGTVLYRGATVRRNSESSLIVTHSFVQDSDYHLQQKVALDQDGEPILNEAQKAAFVYWVQPFNSLGNFSSLSDNFR
tara:strand:+ start:417 stop:1247 length:831 start_codon:yes stop_codon:yes gene_type:complete